MSRAPMEHPVRDKSGPTKATGQHLAILDGWRALCILLVIAGHQLPLDVIVPASNATAAAGGMAIFFTLSGFLITRFLWQRPEPKPFMIRRLLRIIPLAWLAVLLLFIAQGPDRSLESLFANLGFYANLPPTQLMHGGGHLWSLGVEMQFYVVVALIAGLFGRKGLYLVPVLALACTLARIAAGEPLSIVTWHRVDEILAGGTLALAYLGAFGRWPGMAMARLNFYVVAAIAVLCTYFMATPLAYARPYAVAAMVGVTLWNAPAWLERIFASRPTAYIAKISYALYVFHVMLQETWLGSGDTLEKYLKRPLLFAATWFAAHVSTYYWEERFIRLGRRLTQKKPQAAPETPAPRATTDRALASGDD